MKYYFIAGEASGDLHGANLIQAIRDKDPNAFFVGFGGDKMQKAGMQLSKHYREMAFMGPIEVLLHIRTILKNMRACKHDILKHRPDAVVLIDYSGFNLRIAKWLKTDYAHPTKVFYYISPQVWATRPARALKIKAYTDRLFVIFPFEIGFYKKYELEVSYIGHPLLDIVQKHLVRADFFSRNQLNPEKPIIALLPGSRRQEVKRILTKMLSVVKHFQTYQFIIAAAPSLPIEFYKEIIAAHGAEKYITCLYDQTYDTLAHSQAALVTSGTATLETALFEVPQVVCYTTNPIFYWIVRLLIHIKFIAIVNLIMDKAIVKELIQSELNETNLKASLEEILAPPNQLKIRENYLAMKKLLGEKGATDRAAQEIVEFDYSSKMTIL